MITVQVRRTLGDFGVPIAIILMVVLDSVQPGTYTEKLKVPQGLSPSNPSVRGWLISPLGLMAPVPLWVAGAAVVPAVLMYILLFLETHISEYVHEALINIQVGMIKSNKFEQGYKRRTSHFKQSLFLLS